MASQNFSKVIGSTERALRQLLDLQLNDTGTMFEWWTILVLLNTEEYTADEICVQLLRSHVVQSAEAAGTSILAMQSADLLVVQDGGKYKMSSVGKERFEKISGKVQAVMSHVLREIDESDMLYVERVLAGVLSRANEILAGSH